MQPDTIIPSPSNPQSWNRFSNVQNNPVRYNDPSGHICVDKGTTDGDCTRENFSDYKKNFILANSISRKYKNITIQNPGLWEYGDLQEIDAGLNAINGKNGFNGDMVAFVTAFGEVTFVPAANGSLGYQTDSNGNKVYNVATTANGIVNVTPDADMWNIVHEMGHVFSANPLITGRTSHTFAQMYSNVFNHTQPGTTLYGTTNTGEDFADSFYAVIRYGPNNMPRDTINSDRIHVITALIQSYIDLNQTTGR